MPYKDKDKQREYWKEYHKKWREENHEHSVEVNRAWNKKVRENPEWVEHKKEYMKEWRQLNKDHRREYRNKYNKDKYDNDPNYKIMWLLRTRLQKLLKSGKLNNKPQRSNNLLGCSPSLACLILEAQCLAYPNMSWENHGEWHIDHIRPLSSFDLNNDDDLKIACHISNLQPLWAKDNLSKGSSYETN